MIVVDANVAIKWVVDQPNRAKAREIVAAGTPLIAPGLFVAEVTSALWQYARAGAIEPDQARQGLPVILNQIAMFASDEKLAGQAIELGLELNYAPYDMFYLALAVERGAPLVTADQRFVNQIARSPHKSSVVHLNDWA